MKAFREGKGIEWLELAAVGSRYNWEIYPIEATAINLIAGRWASLAVSCAASMCWGPDPFPFEVRES